MTVLTKRRQSTIISPFLASTPCTNATRSTAQDALGHRNPSTTRVYGRRVAVTRDRHSVAIGDWLGIE
jgi:hypothetical protein